MERRAVQAETQGANLRQEVGRLRDRNSRLKDELRQSQGSIADFLKDVAEKRAFIKQLEDDLVSLRSSCSRLGTSSAYQQQQQQQQLSPRRDQKVKPPVSQLEEEKPQQHPETRSIQDEILSQAGQQLSLGPSPFCGKMATQEVSDSNGTESKDLHAMAKLIEERDFYRQQLTEATDRAKSIAGIIKHGLLEKFNALERQVRLERRENTRLTEQLRKCFTRRAAACSDAACQVGGPFMRSEPGRFDARFPRGIFLHQHRRLSTGRIGKFFRTGSEGSQLKLDSSVDALDLAVKSAAASSKTVGQSAAPAASSSLPAAPTPGIASGNSERPVHHRSEPAQAMTSSAASAGEAEKPSQRQGGQYSRRLRKVSFGATLSPAAPQDQQDRDRYLQDLVTRPVDSEDASLTEEERRQSRLLLEQASKASGRTREDSTSASSPEVSLRNSKRPSRTSSSVLSSMKESDYSMRSLSEQWGASLSQDGFSRSQSQSQSVDPVESVDAAAAAASAAADAAVEPASGQAAKSRGHSRSLAGDASTSSEPLVPFPSLPNARLQSLSLFPASLSDLDARNSSVSLIDPGRRFRLEDVPDSELEDRVRALAISFSNDSTTLVDRVKRLALSRTNLERNVASELLALEADLSALTACSLASQPTQLTAGGLGVLRELLDKLNRTAEILGAVQQETRLNYAFHLMLKYMEMLKEEKEKQTAELDQMRQAMDEGKFYMPDEDLMSKRSKSVIGAASQKEGQRNKFQDLGRTVARTSSITSLRRRMSRDRKSADDPDGDKRDGGSKDSKKWKIEEEIYQSGFERGVRMSTSQQLSQLKTEQAAFSDQLERMTDRQHLTEAEEADLERLSSDWLADKRLRLFVAPFTLLAVAVLLVWAIVYPIFKQILSR